MLAIACAIEAAGFDTFLPQRDGLEAHLLGFLNAPAAAGVTPLRRLADRAIFSLDVFQIVERCGLMVVNLNGRVPDEGAVAEAAIAYAVGKPVVLYKDDCRAPFLGRDNSMLLGLTSVDLVTGLDDLPRSLQAASSSNDAAAASLGSAKLRADRAVGERIWQLLDKLSPRDGKPDPAVLVQKIAAVCSEGDSDADPTPTNDAVIDSG